MKRRKFVFMIVSLVASLLTGCKPAPTPSSASSPPESNSLPTPPVDQNALLKSIVATMPKKGGSKGESHQGKLQIGSFLLKTDVDVPVAIATNNESAAIDYGHVIVIEFANGRVLLDDTERVKLPPGTKEVEIVVISGKLSVSADNSVIFSDPK